MLQGTLDVFSLDEVLGLLSGAKKSGVLNITGDRGVGTVAISDGLLVAGSASSAPTADELADVVFELLRFEEGSFSFDGDAVAEGEPEELETVLTEAHDRLGEWRDIEAVVPTLDHHLALADSLSTSQVTLNESEWAAIVAIGEGASVGVVANRLDLGEFDGSKRVKGLVERSLATISAAAPAAPPPADLPVEPPPAVLPVEAPADEVPSFETPLFETPAPAPAHLDVPVTEPAVEVAPSVEVPSTTDVPAVEGDGSGADSEVESIPPMPEAPRMEPAASDEPDAEVDIPPMPEPPSTLDEAAIAGEFAAPIEAETFESLPATDDRAPAPFGGLDPIGSVDMFEPPQRNTDGPDDGFSIADDVPAAPVAVAPTEMPDTSDDIPSLAPPAFDPDAFAVNNDRDDDYGTDTGADPFASPATDHSADEASDSAADADADDADAQPDKGGSILMRYLKSHG